MRVISGTQSSKIAHESSPMTAIEQLASAVDSDFARVDQLIGERTVEDVELIPRIARYLVDSGGKRIRPLLALGATRLCGHPGGDNAIKIAAAVEFIHTATLLHDDVVDEASQRRGQESANLLWGNKASILVGDYLFSQAFQLMVETGDLKILQLLSEAAGAIAKGEVMQLTTASDLETSEERYMEVVQAKTATLFSAATQTGALLADKTGLQHCLRQYGLHLGAAFQLIDDVLDYCGEPKKFGKKPGTDLAEGKATLPVIFAYRAAASREEKGFWRRIVERGEHEPSDLPRAMRLIEKHGGFSATASLARQSAQKAKNALVVFGDKPLARIFRDLADFCVARAV